MSGPTTRFSEAWPLGLAQIRIGAYSGNIGTITSVLTASNSMGAMSDTRFLGNADFFRQMSGFPLNEDGVIPLRENAAFECSFQEFTPNNIAIARGIDPLAAINSAAVCNISLASAAGTVSTTNLITTVAAGAGVVDDIWTVVFSSATAYDVYGLVSGDVGNGTISVDFSPDNGGNPYFTIPGGSPHFTGTWATGDIYVFSTSAYKASGSALFTGPQTGKLPIGGMLAPAYVRAEVVYTFPDGHTLTWIFPRAQIAASQEIDFAAEDAAASPITIQAKKADSSVTGSNPGNAAWDFNASTGVGPLGRAIWAAA